MLHHEFSNRCLIPQLCFCEVNAIGSVIGFELSVVGFVTVYVAFKDGAHVADDH